MLPGAEIAEGALFPKGGMHRVVQSLLALAAQQGVEIRYKAEVEKIIVNGKKAEGILLDDGTIGSCRSGGCQCRFTLRLRSAFAR